jgi:hypothetical protein
MAATDMSYTLEQHGDDFEKAYWHAFLMDEFPSYGAISCGAAM